MSDNTRFVRGPGLTLLSPDQCEKIRSSALEILERNGVRIADEQVFGELGGAGPRWQRSSPSWMCRGAA
jgi:trimethylamine:corrinoid methyltransferase-like protein